MLIIFMIEFIRRWKSNIWTLFFIRESLISSWRIIPSWSTGTTCWMVTRCSKRIVYFVLQWGQKFLFSPDSNNWMIHGMWYAELAHPHGNFTSWFISKSMDSRHMRHSLSFTKSGTGFSKLLRASIVRKLFNNNILRFRFILLNNLSKTFYTFFIYCASLKDRF